MRRNERHTINKRKRKKSLFRQHFDKHIFLAAKKICILESRFMDLNSSYLFFFSRI